LDTVATLRLTVPPLGRCLERAEKGERDRCPRSHRTSVLKQNADAMLIICGRWGSEQMMFYTAFASKIRATHNGTRRS